MIWYFVMLFFAVMETVSFTMWFVSVTKFGFDDGWKNFIIWSLAVGFAAIGAIASNSIATGNQTSNSIFFVQIMVAVSFIYWAFCWIMFFVERNKKREKQEHVETKH